MPRAKLIGIGSTCAYASQLKSLTEDRFMDGEIHGSVYAYAFTKRLLYTGITAYNDQFGLNGNYVIPPTLFGEYDDFHEDTAHVTGALIARFVAATADNAPEVEVWGDGTQIREFLYVRDFVRTMVDLIEPMNRDVINIGPGKGIAIKSLATEIAKAAGYEGRILFNKDRYVGIKEKYMTTDKLERKFGVRLSEDISEGISRTVAWYAKNIDRLRGRRKFDR